MVLGPIALRQRHRGDENLAAETGSCFQRRPHHRRDVASSEGFHGGGIENERPAHDRSSRNRRTSSSSTGPSCSVSSSSHKRKAVCRRRRSTTGRIARRLGRQVLFGVLQRIDETSSIVPETLLFVEATVVIVPR